MINVKPSETIALANWTTVDLGDGKFALKADSGKYLAYC